MFNKITHPKIYLGIICAFLIMHPAVSGVTAERTRIIFNQADRENSLLLVNQNIYPVLTQLWIDNGELETDPNYVKAPFLPLPPIFRMEPSEQRSVRIIKTEDPAHSDRESLYWLNIYEIPPRLKKNDSGDQAHLTVTLRTQMKVFYRPSDLRLDPELAPKKLIFNIKKVSSTEVLKISNPSPYFITLTGVNIKKSNTVIANGKLIPPFEDVELSILKRIDNDQELEFGWIEDDGNLQYQTFKLESPQFP